MKPRVLYMPVRVALTGKTVAPGLYESLELLGREESLARIDAALGTPGRLTSARSARIRLQIAPSCRIIVCNG